jgi:hypothetical protein
VPQAGLGDPALVYGEEKDLFRFRDGRFAFSREHGNWELLKKRGRMRSFEESW